VTADSVTADSTQHTRRTPRDEPAYRRSRALVLYWHDGQLVADNYLRRRSTDTEQPWAVTVDAAALELLGHFDEWRTASSVAAEFPDHEPGSVIEAVAQLVAHGLLSTRSEGDREDDFTAAWQHWSTEARMFHFGTKDAIYIGDDEEHRRAGAALVTASGPPPPIFKAPSGAPQVRLPREFLPLDRPYGDVLTARRTRRDFMRSPVTLTELATVLHYVFAPMHFIDAREFGTLFLRTSPCGGARQEIECYVGVRAVQGLEPGLYHYRPDTHALELVDDAYGPPMTGRLSFDQRMCGGAAFLCYLTVVFERAMYKYRHPRAYRVVLLDAGHLAQTFVLTCTALGLGAFQTAAFRDSEVEDALGLDGVREAPVYLLGAGRIVPRDPREPLDLEPARLPPRGSEAR
jgi:SagB-type dehydrogenase family enzyme